ncbi:chaperone protein dnaJ 11 chloroplastic-like [Tripterygium wilfordii]|uniref:Chaperone protein dnaJ 11 chloroplastic-like n=1 Tax=Tripterygium wilfordii TaxID=458696 RepID=A0A7J7DGI6_TRIWF|nr:chaperone protein dnaJ 11, chloroplastic-like [Tripterygium wilfordii]KAF5745374.1 chaperone protein dnaJ 11 chloroplastic-like [Tripterygium wilfordii]
MFCISGSSRVCKTYGLASMASTSSFYELLGIPTSASCGEIKAAYRRLARVCHPDVVSINQKEMSANEFKKIHVAYSTLSDPNKRATYDRNLYASPRRKGLSAAAASAIKFSGYASRNWETDQCW